ncbi:DUF3857 domain-containing protein [Terrimonas sp. NA20]|uniref:DUF3857 domain-containing protein n=1 Tax=Terrimonas ginsenosidimutans TaxID=2908004 RepID=A0ABS9KWV9_9BACT|nr:DUF3857 domain-containing protein [Terrimonas ginsenosidimutans]MCG2616827.1 DUF3857 domain-containing protein [Terrimonas ginsenosidimutans]
MKSVLTRIAVSATCFLFVINSTHGQAKSDAEYHKESEEIRKTVWAWDKAEFRVKEIPARYAGASSVVIARHTELTADSKSKLGYNGFLGFSSNKIMSVSEIAREMVKVNDKSAVEEYSEFSFTRFENKSGFHRKDNSTTFVGVRVIKADGKVREINADDIVFTNESKSEKKAKVAIPDLQPGDIVDYFIATNIRLTNDFTDKSYVVTLFDESPVLHHSFHGQLGKKFAIDYRSYNGAPDLNVSKNSDDDIVIDVVKKDIPAFETTLWVSPALQLPFVRMFISLGNRGGIGRKFAGYSKPGEVNKNKETDEIVELKANNMALEFYNSVYIPQSIAYFNEIIKNAKVYAKNLGIDFKKMEDEEKAIFVYYAARFTRLLDFNVNNMERSINIGKQSFDGLALFTYCSLLAADIEGSVLLSNYRKGYRMQEVMDMDDIAMSTFLRGTNKFMGFSSVFSTPFETPETVEGVTDTKVVNLRVKGSVGGANGIAKLATVLPGIKVPVSESGKNAHIEQLILSLTPGETLLNVKRKSIIKGNFKADLQGRLILYEDFYESELRAFGESKSLIEQLEENKRTRKLAEDAKNAFAEARKKQKTSFLDETKEWFEQEISNQKEMKIDNMGVRHTAPDFIYSSSFDMEGLVKKAGNNIILEIGKIQGTPMSIKPEQRKRDIDVYMSYPRSIEYHVKVQIPEGYAVEGVDGLNRNVRNETGYFTVQANLVGKTVEIKVSKHYFHGYEPAANWNKLVEFIDAANEWTNAKLLLKKN